MKRCGWMMGLMAMAVILAAASMPAAAQNCGQMDHSNCNNAGTGHMMSGNTGSGHMGSQTSSGYPSSYSYADPNAAAAGQPAGTGVPASSGQASGDHSGHIHNN